MDYDPSKMKKTIEIINGKEVPVYKCPPFMSGLKADLTKTKSEDDEIEEFTAEEDTEDKDEVKVYCEYKNEEEETYSQKYMPEHDAFSKLFDTID